MSLDEELKDLEEQDKGLIEINTLGKMLSAEVEHLGNILPIDSDKVNFQMGLTDIVERASELLEKSNGYNLSVRPLELSFRKLSKLDFFDRLYYAIAFDYSMNGLMFGDTYYLDGIDKEFKSENRPISRFFGSLFIGKSFIINTVRNAVKNYFLFDDEVKTQDLVLFEKADFNFYMGIVIGLKDEVVSLVYHSGKNLQTIDVNQDYVLAKLKPKQVLHNDCREYNSQIPIVILGENPCLGFIKQTYHTFELYSDRNLTKKIKDLSISDHKEGKYDIIVLGAAK